MKHIPTFESFLNEDKAERLTISASLWKGRTPEIKKSSRETQFLFFSGEVFGGKYLNILGKPSNVLIVIEHPTNGDKLYIKNGYGSEDRYGEKLYRVSIGDSVNVTIDELKADPKGIAKKVAENFIASKKYFDMNFEPFDKRAIFKMEKDLEIPALDLINFAIKNL